MCVCNAQIDPVTLKLSDTSGCYCIYSVRVHSIFHSVYSTRPHMAVSNASDIMPQHLIVYKRV